MRPFATALSILVAAQLVAAHPVQASPLARQSGALFSNQAAAGRAVAEVRSRVRVIVPHGEALLLVEETKIEGSGTLREFDTPPLVSGRIYRYTLAAEWRANSYTVITRNKTVEFLAGDEVTVDLTEDDPKDRARIRYVPTPENVVNLMIELAGIGERDVVYEPGCGDARITIAAVRAGARKGVGIDIDPERVAQSRANVGAAGLEGQIEIRLGDALDIEDLSDASVVFLYMGDEFNMLIRPALWRQLQVGTRVVSHRFTMGDWKPDRTINESLENYGEGYPNVDVHLWTITEEIKQRIARE